MSFLKIAICCTIINAVVANHRPNSSVTLLNTNNFQRLVNNENIWVVHFYSSRNKNFSNEFELSASILKGTVEFGSVDVENDAELAKNLTIDLTKLPTVKVYGIPSKRFPIEYTGPKTVKDLVESVRKSIKELKTKKIRKGKPIVEVNDTNFDKTITTSKEPWMVFFYAPWCLHCEEFKPMWKIVASNLQNKIQCASLDASVNRIKAKEYQITQYPTLQLFPFEQKSPKHVFDYTKQRNVDSIVDWALENLPGPVLKQITNAQVFQTHCMEQTVCVITTVPSIMDCQADCRAFYLDILKELGVKFKKQAWGWVWSEGGAQRDLERILDIGGFGYPVLVVLNPTKMRYSVFKGGFTFNEIDKFLSKLATTKALALKEDVLGNIVSVDAWDGKDTSRDLPEESHKKDKYFKKVEL